MTSNQLCNLYILPPLFAVHIALTAKRSHLSNICRDWIRLHWYHSQYPVTVLEMSEVKRVKNMWPGQIFIFGSPHQNQ